MLSKEGIEQAKENINGARQYNTTGIVPNWADVDILMKYIQQLEADKTKANREVRRRNKLEAGQID